VAPAPALVDALRAAASRETSAGAAAGTIVTTDLFYDERKPEIGWRSAGAIAVEMESSVLFTLAQKRDIAAGTLLIVSDRLFPARDRIDPGQLGLAELQMGRVALSALGIHAQASTST
jgi:purine-nucleoside phosphorylase